MLDWLGGLIGSFGGALGNVFSTFGEGIVDSIWDGLTKYSIAAAWKLVNGIFMITGALTARVFTTSGLTDGNIWAGITAPDFDDTGILKIISNLMAVINPLSQIPSLLLGLIGFIVAVVLSVTLLLTVIGRFFKI